MQMIGRSQKLNVYSSFLSLRLLAKFLSFGNRTSIRNSFMALNSKTMCGIFTQLIVKNEWKPYLLLLSITNWDNDK